MEVDNISYVTSCMTSLKLIKKKNAMDMIRYDHDWNVQKYISV
jgi:phosphotransferase system IIB component